MRNGRVWPQSSRTNSKFKAGRFVLDKVRS